MSAIFADQRLSQAAIRRNRHVLFRIAQSRALPVGLVKSGALQRPRSDFLQTSEHPEYGMLRLWCGETKGQSARQPDRGKGGHTDDCPQ